MNLKYIKPLNYEINDIKYLLIMRISLNSKDECSFKYFQNFWIVYSRSKRKEKFC